MEKETRVTLIVIAVVAVLLIGGYAGVKAYSGVSPPFTVVNSGSMMHSSDSKIGIIDTGDMILVKDPNEVDIQTYVDGYKSGHKTFGEYGDVIVYKKPNQNIIHRAMLYLELKESTSDYVKWYIPSLADYSRWEMSHGSTFVPDETLKSECWNEETCELTISKTNSDSFFWLTDVGYGNVNVPISLYNMGKGHSANYAGYLTKGDNASTNRSFDQASGIYEGKLVEKNNIKSVAMYEIPWIGSIKLLAKGNGSTVPSNTYTSLILTLLALIAFIVIVNVLINCISKEIRIRKEREKETISEEKKEED